MDAQLSQSTSGLSYEQIHCFNAWQARNLLDNLLNNGAEETPIGFHMVGVVDHVIGLETRCAQITAQNRALGEENYVLHEVIHEKDAEVKHLHDFIKGKKAPTASTRCLCCPLEVSKTIPDSKGNIRTVNYCDEHFLEKSAEYERRIKASGGEPITCMCCQKAPAPTPTAWFCKDCFRKVNAGVRPLEPGYEPCYGFNQSGCLHGINGKKSENKPLCPACHAYGKTLAPEVKAPVTILRPGWAHCKGNGCTRQTDLSWGPLCKDCNNLTKERRFAPKPVAVQHPLCELCGVQVPPAIKAVHDAGKKHQELLNQDRTKASAKPAEKLLKK
jgi:hypothetical protein